MASFRKSASGWRAELYVKGVRDSASFTTKAQAQAWAAKRETELREQKGPGIIAGKTLLNAFNRYELEVSKTKRGYRWEALRMNAMAEFKIDGVKMGDMLLADLTPEIIGKWRDERLKSVVGSTVNRDMNLLSNVLSIARMEWRWIEDRPTKTVRRPKESPARDRRILQDEIDRMTYALGFIDGEKAQTKSQRVAIAFLFAIETAMRAGEVCGLTQAMLSEQVARLPAELTKNGHKRDVPLSKRALELLAMLPEKDPKEEGEPPIFGITTATLDALFRKAKAACMINDMTFHDSRHEAITRLAKKLNVLELARMVGHRDLRQLQVYYNETAAEIAAKLD